MIAGTPLHGLLSTATTVASLNMGSGVTFAGGGTKDLHVTLHDGTSFDMAFNAPATIADVLAQLAAASPGTSKFQAQINDTQDGLVLIDHTTGMANFAVTALNGSLAGAGLGLLGNDGGVLVGNSLSGRSISDNFFVVAPLDDATPLASLNGSDGVTLNSSGAEIHVALHDGTGFDVAFNGALTRGAVLNAIRAARWAARK